MTLVTTFFSLSPSSPDAVDVKTQGAVIHILRNVDIRYSGNVADMVALILEGDRVFLRQALVNLRHHAVKHSPMGGSISVSVWKRRL
jgi:signal transduction histidine kinase